MQKLKSSLMLLFTIFFISNISAIALGVSPSTFNINKSVGVLSYFNVNISNNNPFAFYNISLESNSLLSMGTIATLNPGEYKTVNITVISTSDFNSTFKIKGFYSTNTGQQNKYYGVNISSYDAVLNPCDFTIIKGDTVKFFNKLNNVIIIKDLNNNQDVASLGYNTGYDLYFGNPTSFRYAIYISGFRLTNVCTISVLDTMGLVNDPQLDGILNVNLKNNYIPTVVTSTLLNTNFSMDFFGSQDGIMTVTNNGGEIAHSVNLIGDWLTFSPNNFDLSPGESKGIIYKIVPTILTTADTNKTYNKTITIAGNFPTITNTINVYIKYAQFDGNSTSKEDIDYLKNTYCPLYPNSILCNGTGQNIVYRYINNATDRVIDFNMTESQLRDLWIYMFNTGDKIDTLNNYMKEQIENITTSQAETSEKTKALILLSQATKEEQDAAKKNIMFLLIFTIFSITIGIIVLLIYLKRRQNKLEELRKW